MQPLAQDEVVSVSEAAGGVGAVQPLAQDEVVSVSEAAGGVGAVEQGLSGVVHGYTSAIGAGDLVVGPGECASCRPARRGTGLPVQPLALQPVALVPFFFGGGGCRVMSA